MKTYVLFFFAVCCIAGNHASKSAGSACSYSSCSNSCKDIFWNVGYCKKDECWCWKYGPAATRIQKPLSEVPSSETGECVASDCDELCSPSKGHCAKGLCWCWRNKKRHSGTRVEKHLKGHSADESPCEWATCNQSCVAAKSGGGYCKNGQCLCWKHNSSMPGRHLSRKWHFNQPKQEINAAEPLLTMSSQSMGTANDCS